MIKLTEVKNTLSLQEADRFDDLEICIANGLQTFVEVGNALAEIRDGRLYRVHYGTFEDYCQKRWGMSRPRAYQMIEAAGVISNLSTMVDIPTSERQARALTALTPDQQREVWQTAVSTAPNGKVTAAHVEATKKQYLAPVTEYDEAEAPSGYYEDDYDELYTVENEGEGITPPLADNRPPHVSYNSGNNEWYTPSEIVEAARIVMGSIDLDPASSLVANEVVKAGNIYTVDDDGLTFDWFGNVWMNPPYAGDLIGKFCEKIHREHTAGHINAAIILVNNATETQWFALLASSASAICFPASRVKFWKPDGSTGQPLQGQAIIYFGDDIYGFTDAYSSIGFVVEVLNG